MDHPAVPMNSCGGVLSMMPAAERPVTAGSADRVLTSHGAYVEDLSLTEPGDFTSRGLRFFVFWRGCLLAMCVDRVFVGTDSPQNRHSAVPAET